MKMAFKILVGLASGTIVGTAVVVAFVYHVVKTFQIEPLD